ncbi:Uncharacterised protein [Vibrio cholerae]|nr:Uncharacterised protein [Vibrio cholerae]
MIVRNGVTTVGKGEQNAFCAADRQFIFIAAGFARLGQFISIAK